MVRALGVAVLVVSGCAQLIGLQDPPPGSDTPDVCAIDTDCAAHEYCTIERTCECVAGYARGGGACTWSGVVISAGFDLENPWTANGATINPTILDTGMMDPGAAKFAPGSCDGGLSQVVTMPRYSRAEPLVSVVSYRNPEAITGGVPGTLVTGMSLGIGRGWSESVGRGDLQGWIQSRRCLGPAQYAAESTIGFGADALVTFPRPQEGGGLVGGQCMFEVDIDRIDIVPALPGECPAPNTATNSTADTDEGWRFGLYRAGTAGFAAGVGDGGSRAGRLNSPNLCDFMWLTVPYTTDVGDTTGSPQLSFYTRQTAGKYLRVWLGTKFAREVNGRGSTPTIVRFCVPASSRGVATQFAVEYNGAFGTCGDPAGEVIVDSIGVENDPACGTDPYLADPGFDSDYEVVGAYGYSGGSAAKTFDPVFVHGGRGALALSIGTCTANSYFTADVATPPTSTTGAALTFWYRTVGLSGSSPLYAGSQMLPAATTWTQSKVCLDPKSPPGRGQQITFGLFAVCSGGVSASAYLDDLAVVADPTCPH